MIQPSDPYTRLLTAIATALDVPATAFVHQPPAGDGGDVIALLRAWAAIGDAQGQRRVLNTALREAERAVSGANLSREVKT